MMYDVFFAPPVGIAGIEIIADRSSEVFTDDVNTNTNYNPDAEARAGLFGMRRIAKHLDRLLRQEQTARAA